MRLVYLYGPPGVGKLTVAHELVALTGFSLLHNHLTVDLVRAVFAYGTETYTRLVRQFRQDMISEAVRADVDLVITGVFLGTQEQLDAIQRMIAPIFASGGAVLFAQLTCDRATWLARVSDRSRHDRRKLTDPERVVGLFNGNDPFAIMPVGPHFRIDTTHRSASEAAAQIAAYYALPVGGA